MDVVCNCFMKTNEICVSMDVGLQPLFSGSLFMITNLAVLEASLSLARGQELVCSILTKWMFLKGE